MILNENYIEGANNSSVLLQQRNHNAVQMLKQRWKHFSGMISSDGCTIFDSGRIVNVGPGVELYFTSDFNIVSTAVIYGDIDMIKAWIKRAIEELKNNPLYK